MLRLKRKGERGESQMSASPKRILILENDYLIADLVAGFLDELGYSILGPTYELNEASKLAAEETFDGALLDWHLDSGGSGNIADILIKRGIPFIFATGYDAIPDAKYRDIAVLKKPFGHDALQRALERMVRPD
jgi:DNA-binding response OmpR family regulator